RLSPSATTVTGSAATATPEKINAIVTLQAARNAPYAMVMPPCRKFPMSSPVLALTDARLTLAGNAGPVDILRGITLAVNRGETIGLTGPSGSGKSSLLMLMGGLERATGGEVRALDRDLTAMDEDALARFRRDN